MKAWRHAKAGSGWGRNHRVQKTVGSVNRNSWFGPSLLLQALLRKVGLYERE